MVSKQKTLEDDTLQILQMYENGMTQREISAYYQVSPITVSRFLRKHGICRGHINDSEYNAVVTMYLSGITVKKIAQNYRVGEETIYSILKSHDIKLKAYGEHSIKYTLNQHYFDEIDTSNKAYILGLLFADGYNSNKSIALSLQEQDKELLDKINSEIDSNRPLLFIDYSKRNGNCKNQYRLTITNKYIVTQLSSLGVIKNKSLVLTFPEYIDSSLLPHFLRGYIDGDGHIHKTEHRVQFIGTLEFCSIAAEKIQDCLHIHCGIYKAKKESLSNTYILQIAGKQQVQCFLNYIYNDAELFLNRKYQIYQERYVKE